MMRRGTCCGWALVVAMVVFPMVSQAFFIRVSGLVSDYFSGDPLKGVQVRLVKDSIERATVITGRDGNYEIYIERGYDYLLWFHREDMVTKHVRINAREIPLFPDVPYYDMDIQMTMVEWFEGFDFSAFEKPMGLAEYKHSVRNLNWDIDYTEARRAEMARVMVLYEREYARRMRKPLVADHKRKARKRAYF